MTVAGLRSFIWELCAKCGGMHIEGALSACKQDQVQDDRDWATRDILRKSFETRE